MPGPDHEFHQQVIAEFRSSGGQVGGPFAGVPLLLLHHRGARTGEERLSPLSFRPHNDSWVVFASDRGAAKHPDWYWNLLAHPDASIEIGSDTVPVRARVTSVDERDAIWSAQKRDVPVFADYEANVDREIPVILLEPR